MATLLATLGTPVKGIAIAVNRALVSRSAWTEHLLQPGDRVDIVQAIGGG